MRKLNWQRPAQHKWPTGKSAHASVLHSSCWQGSAAAVGWQHDRDLRKVTKPLLSNACIAFFDQDNASARLPDSHKPQAGNTCSAKAGKGLGGQSARYPPSCWQSPHSAAGWREATTASSPILAAFLAQQASLVAKAAPLLASPSTSCKLASLANLTTP